MTRVLAPLVLVGLLAATAFPQPPRQPVQDIITLTVSPTAAPVPALKYELLPKRRTLTPGNAALHYQRAYTLRPEWPRDPKEAVALNGG